MKFKHGTRRRALEYEKDWVQRWKLDKTFEKSVEQRPTDNSYVFYDGPPFISGDPHHGTLLSSIVKDAVPRYQTMKGKRVERVWGWDCHGLPAERFTEKKLGLSSREEVIDYGIEKYIKACRANMVQTSSEWNDVVDRVGRWVDMDNAYKTMDKEYMESVWWAFKTLYDKGSIFEGEKVLMYCTTDATPLSKAEVTMDAGAYQDVTDPSVFVKFHLKSGQKYADNRYETKDSAYILAWTTTPWTLPANTALAVNNDMKYTALRINNVKELLIVASEKVEELFKEDDVEIVHDDIRGSDLVGLEYEPLIPIPAVMGDIAIGNQDKRADDSAPSDAALVDQKYKVWSADYVSSESGTGIVHVAPTYGEEDYELARKNSIPGFHAVDDNGNFYQPVADVLYEFMPWLDSSKPLNIWECNKDIAKSLKKAGMIWKIDYIRHPYPHCHRCGTKLMYRAHPSWFVDIEGQREKMLEKNQPINWFPKHLKHGRFEKTVQSAPDWNISRDRFWATAMPVWKTESGKVKVIGSYAELTELSGKTLDDYHRPWVDDITFDIDGETYTRTDKVMDSWFEAASMPFAQFHYPFENKEKFENNFPGEFIVEYVAQVRAWFYYMHAMSVALFGENSFKNVITTGTLAGNDGRKMSKSLGNYTDPNELMDKFSADSLRFTLLASPVLNGEDFTLQDKEVGDVARKLSMVWNMYDFFTMYAEVDGWEFDGDLSDPLEHLKNPLDIWIVSRLHQLVAEVERHMDAYNIPDALSPVLPFLDDASNWYVRRSRRRFWKSEDDGDKNDAYKTLHYVLTRISYVLAPFTPFLAEELHEKMTGDAESVHLKDWMPAGQINELVMNDMETVREYVNEGLSMRARSGLKVRQPLASVTVPAAGTHVDFESILIDELNVKSVIIGETVAIDQELTPELKREGLMREVVRHVQSARKQAELNIDDRIQLNLQAESSTLKQAIDEHIDEIKRETLAEQLTDTTKNQQTVKVEGDELSIGLERVGN